MKALLINPAEGFCFFGFPESRRLMGKKASGPPLGLITAAAILPQDWELRLVDCAVRLPTEEDWTWPDLVMLSGNYLHRTSVLRLIQDATARGKPVVVGGPYASSVPEELLDAGADFVVVGEGENTVPMLLEALGDGEKQGVFRNNDKPDLNASPVPRFDLVQWDMYQHAQVQTSRGCPFMCEFCDIIIMYGRTPRYKSPSQVIAELEELYRLGWRGPVFVADDNFIGNKKHAKETLREMLGWQMRRGKPFTFFTQASMNLGKDSELIDLMTAACFGNIFVGVESPDENVLKLAQKNQNVSANMMESLDAMNRNGLPVLASFVMGFDGESEGVGRRIVELMERTSIPVAMVGTLWALPNTSLWKRLKAEGRILDHVGVPENFIGGKFNFVTSRPESEIINEFIDVWNLLYEPSRFLGRCYRYFLTMRPTRKALERQTGTKDTTFVSRPPSPFKQVLSELRSLILLVWELGIRASCRVQFWQQLIGMLRKNPSRLRQYIVACGYGPDMFRVRQMLIEQRSGLPHTENRSGR